MRMFVKVLVLSTLSCAASLALADSFSDELAQLKIKDAEFEAEWPKFIESRQTDWLMRRPWRAEESSINSRHYLATNDFVSAFVVEKISEFLMIKYAAVAALESKSKRREKIYEAMIDRLAEKFVYLAVEIQTARKPFSMMPADRPLSRGEAGGILTLILDAALTRDEEVSRLVLERMKARLASAEFLAKIRLRARVRGPLAAAQRGALALVAPLLGPGGGFIASIVLWAKEIHPEVVEALGPQSTSPCRRLLEIQIPERKRDDVEDSSPL